MSASPLRRIWKRVPEGLRRRAWLTVFAARRAVLPLRHAVGRRLAYRSRGEGVDVVGLFTDTRGVAQAARLFADALEQGGVRVTRLDAGPALGIPSVLSPARPVAERPRSRVLVSCLNPPELVRWMAANGGAMTHGRRHIGYWAWELPIAPPEWAQALRYVDEVWCHSAFAAEAIRALAPPGFPVRVAPLPVSAAPAPGPDRARFGLPEDACVVLMAADLRSTLARKNPLGSIAAFIAAQPTPAPDVLLVCKVSGMETEGPQAASIARAVGGRADIRLLRELLSEADMMQLVASADIVLSLHRAEGFGLLPAEAAWLGRPVVATGWSAPTEFLTPEGAALVSWSPAPVSDVQGIYDGAWAQAATWAEPDLADASRRLRALIADPELRRRMGEAARRHAREVFDLGAWVRKVAHDLPARARRG